jgi:NADH-quinone oxidoreductase subunit H
LLSVAFLTLFERLLMALLQRRMGPNVIGPYGLLQPIADGLKLLLKEIIIPTNADKFIFLLAPVLSFGISLLVWGVIPFSSKGVLSDINASVIYSLSISSLGVYGIILGGWSSNSKYAFLGSLRSTAQMISYEVSLGFCVCAVCVCCGSYNYKEIILAQRYMLYAVPLATIAIIFFISGLAETNRHPFDLPEAESELVAGFNTEYSGFSFALYSLAEYSNILMMCTIQSILFLGGYQSLIFFIPNGSFWLACKILFFASLFILARVHLPRYKYNQLMYFGWTSCLPVSIAFFFFQYTLIWVFNMFPK